MRTFLVLIPWLSLLGACHEPVSCLTDSDCEVGAYCRATQCVVPSADGELNAVFEERIRPIVETGCGCHGPDSGRPWSYFAPDEKNTDKLARALVTKAWAYDPMPTVLGDQPVSRPAILSYVTGECGLSHPSVYSDLEAPQFKELELWFAQVVKQLSGVALPEQDQPIQAAEALRMATALDDQAKADIEELENEIVLKKHIEPRIVAHCGCCHTAQGTAPRFFKLNTDFRRDESEYQANVEAITAYGGSLLTYGFGEAGNEHPVIWMGPEDVRAQVIELWLQKVAQNPPQSQPPADVNDGLDSDPSTSVMGPTDVEEPDGMLGQADESAEDWLATYKSSINGHLVTGCRCHGPNATNGWAHGLVNDDEETLKRNLAGIAEQVDLDDAANSDLLKYPLGLFDGIHKRGDTGLYDGVDDPNYMMMKIWIESLPSTFPQLP